MLQRNISENNQWKAADKSRAQSQGQADGGGEGGSGQARGEVTENAQSCPSGERRCALLFL